MSFMNTHFLFSQESTTTNISNQRNGGVYITYNNLVDNNNTTKLLGCGILIYNNKLSSYLDAEFSFAIGSNQNNLKNPFAQINIGFPIIYLTKNTERKLPSEISGGFGISQFYTIDELGKSKSYMGFQPFVEITLNCYGVFIRSKVGPIFSTGAGNFQTGSLQLGYSLNWWIMNHLPCGLYFILCCQMCSKSTTSMELWYKGGGSEDD